MKILKKYANGGKSTKDDTKRTGGRVIGPGGRPPEKEKGNPFNTGTGSKYRKLKGRLNKRQGPARGRTEPHNSFEMKGRKYMGGGKMKEYGHGGKMKYENGGTIGRAPGGQKEMRDKERLRKKLGGGSTTPGRGGVKAMDTASFKKMKEARRRRSIEKANPGGYKGKKMEFGGVGKEKPSRFERKFAKKRRQYDKDVSKGRTKEAPHERTFKFRPDGQSVFKKRKLYNVENEPELRKRRKDDFYREGERRANIKSPEPQQDQQSPDERPTTPNKERGPRRPRFENGGLHKYSRKTKSNPFSVKAQASKSKQLVHDRKQMDRGRKEERLKDRVRQSNMDPNKKRAFNRKLKDMKQKRSNIKATRVR